MQSILRLRALLAKARAPQSQNRPQGSLGHSMGAKIVKQLILILSTALLFLGCSPDGKTPSFSDLRSEVISATNFFTKSQALFTIVDNSGQPVQAQILIGLALNDPFPGNVLQTDAKGQVAAPKEWTTELPVTVRAPGFVAMTYLQQGPHSMTFKLRKAPMLQRMTLTGTTKGYPIKDRDDQIDFGLIMKAMSKSELLAFDINKVISSDNDSFSVMGQNAEVPSNISLPRQKESYYLPVTIEKNPYRLFMNDSGPQKVIALRGRFPFKKVIDQLRNNKDFVDLINEFSLDGGTIKDVTVAGSTLNLNLDLADLQFQKSISVMTPNHAADEVVLGVVAQDMDGVLMPTDVKKLPDRQSLNLKALDPSKSYVLKVLQRQSDFNAVANASSNPNRLSVIFKSAAETGAGQFLNLIENPRLQGQEMFLDAPKAMTDVNPYATYLVLSELQEIPVGKHTTKIPLVRWEIYSPGWNPQINLPQQPADTLANTAANPQWRWEASFFGGVDSASDLGPDMIQKTTHVTRSSIDF